MLTAFWFLLVLVVIQRLVEVMVAKRNEKQMKAAGAKEFGADHYKWIVLMHVAFFTSLITEVTIGGIGLITFWPLVLAVFILAQAGRFWALLSLGRFWNTKIIVLPGADLVKKGPYKWVSHPNYWIVAIEILTLPLLFEAYITAVLFTVLNAAILLTVRIPKEEEALKWAVKQEREGNYNH